MIVRPATKTCPRCDSPLYMSTAGFPACRPCGWEDYSGPIPNGRKPKPVLLPARYIGDSQRFKGMLLWCRIIPERNNSLAPFLAMPPCPYCGGDMNQRIGFKIIQPNRLRNIRELKRYLCANGHRLTTNGVIWL